MDFISKLSYLFVISDSDNIYKPTEKLIDADLSGHFKMFDYILLTPFCNVFKSIIVFPAGSLPLLERR